MQIEISKDEVDNINEVLSQIRKNLRHYCELLSESEAGNRMTEKELNEIGEDLGCTKINICNGEVDKGVVLTIPIYSSLKSFYSPGPYKANRLCGV